MHAWLEIINIMDMLGFASNVKAMLVCQLARTLL